MQSPTNDQRQRDGADEEQIIDWWNEPDALQRYPNCIEWIRNLRQMRPREGRSRSARGTRASTVGWNERQSKHRIRLNFTRLTIYFIFTVVFALPIPY